MQLTPNGPRRMHGRTEEIMGTADDIKRTTSRGHDVRRLGRADVGIMDGLGRRSSRILAMQCRRVGQYAACDAHEIRSNTAMMQSFPSPSPQRPRQIYAAGPWKVRDAHVHVHVHCS